MTEDHPRLHKKNVIRCANHLMKDLKIQGFFFDAISWDLYDRYGFYVSPTKEQLVVAEVAFRCEVSKRHYPDGPCYKFWVPSGLVHKVNTLKSMTNGAKLLSALELWGLQHGNLLESYPSEKEKQHSISFGYIFSLNPEVYNGG